MHCARVVGLHGVLGQKLPIAGDVVVDPAGRHHVGEVVTAELVGQVAEIVGKRWRRLGETDKDKTLPGVDTHVA